MQRLALAVLGAAPIVLVVASFSDGRWAGLVAALAAAGLPPALILLVAGRERHGRAAALALWALLTGALAGAVMLSWRPVTSGPLGLPWATLLVVVGVALVPLGLLSWTYAAGFRGPPEPPDGADGGAA